MALISSRWAGLPTRPSVTSEAGNAVALKKYDVVINGQKATLQLSDENARAMGLTVAKAKRPANKSRTPANKSVQG